MGSVRRLAPAAGDVPLGQAAEAYLGTLSGAEQASTRRTYGRILRRVVAEFGAETAPDQVNAERFAEWFGSQWADRAPSTWNVSLDAVRSAAAYWQRQGWLAADFSRMLVRRKPRPDRGRALSRGEVDQLLTRGRGTSEQRLALRMILRTLGRRVARGLRS
jgi:site-specific recombinase XerD